MFFSEHAFQCTSITVFVDEIKIILGFQHIIVGDNMLILFDVGQNINFMHCTFFQLFVGLKFLHLNNFDCIFLIIKFIDCPVHFPISSFTDNFIQSIVLDNSNHDPLYQTNILSNVFSEVKIKEKSFNSKTYE